MPRQSRIDAPGGLHHIVVRGIERRLIFRDNTDRDDFLKRLGRVLENTKTPCFAWALIPNHFHLLLKTGAAPIASVMRSLLTGYALSFNRRHKRSGHLFQNRYKSILCQEDVYLLELVRYIHLNPLRSGLVKSLDRLDNYAYSGHGVIMGKTRRAWQDADSVLRLFRGKAGPARRAYKAYVKKGIVMGGRPDLIGGGLIRSAGGWAAVKEMRAENMFQKSDERILGDGDFVESVLAFNAEAMTKKHHLQSKGLTLDKISRQVARLMGMEQEEVWAAGKHRQTVRARGLLCYWAVRELGLSMTSMARELNISVPAVSKSVIRGEALAKEKNYTIEF